jgi:Flp pilus assembly protein TadG
MIKFMTRLWNDRRGNALLIAGAALPVVVGVAGLATDTVQWVLWSRQLQRAADSAAFAGVYAKSLGDDAATSVTTDLANNNQTKNQSGINLKSGFPLITYPTSASNAWSYGVKVQLAVQQNLSFSSLFMTSAPTITVSATAALIDSGDYCVVALENTTATGIKISGNTNTNLGCGAISNSRNSSASVSAGGSYNFTADPVAGVGGLPSAITGVTTLRPYHTAMPDPFAGKYPTTIPASLNCKTFSQNSYTTSTGTGQNRVTTYHLKSDSSGVCYSSFSPNGNTTYYLDPGVYYIDSADMNLNGQDSLIGTDVTIILTGTNPGTISINGTSTVQLTAPTTGAYANMLFIQAANAPANNGNTINGTATSKLDGAFYFPNGQVTFTGTSGDETKCAMVVARQVVFSGNANFQNNTTGCVANEKVKGKEIKLVA